MSARKEAVDPAEAALPRHDHALLRHALRTILTLALVLYFIAIGALVGLRYVLLPRIDDFRPRIETLVSEKLHAQLRIGKLAPHWSGFQPGIDVTDLTIRGRDGKLALDIPHATAAVSWRSLVHFKPTLSSLVVDQPDVLVERSADGSLSVAGVQVPTAHKGNDTFSTWLLEQQAIVLRGGTLRWRDAEHDAPELALRDIRLAILNRGADHRIALQAPANGTVLQGPLDFRAQFRHAHLHAIGKPVNWTGQAYISTGLVDLPALARYMSFPIQTYAGRVANSIWINFSGGHIRSASGDLQGYDVALQVHPTQPKLDVPTADFSWSVDIDPQRDYTLRLSNLRAELGQPPLPDGTPIWRTLAFNTLVGHYRAPSIERGQFMSVTGDRVDLGILAEFSRALPFPRRFLNELVRFDPRGLVANYDMSFERAKPENDEAASEQRVSGAAPIIHYRFKADLQGISLAAQEPPPGLTPKGHPRAGIPGFENLWGAIDADETHGTVALDTVNAAVTVPGAFDNPRLTFDRLSGHGNWTVLPAEPGEKHKPFVITVSDLNVANADTAGRVVANYSNPGHGRGTLDLTANIDHALVTRITRYLPTSISEHLRDYLGHGLQAGMARHGVIEVHGNLDKFPYSIDPKAGIFRITAPFSGGKFDPSPFPPKKLKNGTPDIWPAFDDIDGVFTLKENVLRFDIDKGRYKGVRVTKVAGHIDDLGHKESSPLIIEGQARGPLADLLDYANNSALAGMTNHAADKVRGSGPATLALTLTIPRHPKPHVAVEGSIGFLGNELAANNAPPLSRLTGKVSFTEHSVTLNGINGRWLGGDVRADGALSPSGTYAFNVAGRVAVDAARDLNLHGTAAELLTHVSGSAPYSINVRGAKGRQPEVTASSDLTGLALDLPAPYNKPLGTPMPLSFTFKPLDASDGANLQRADLIFGPLAAAYVLHHPPHEEPTVVRGAIGFNRPADLPDEGVIANIDIQEFDADAWRAFYSGLHATKETLSTDAASASPASSSAGGGTRPAAQYLPSRFALHVDTLKLLHRNWENVVVDASRAGPNWQANIASDQVSGELSWQPGGGRNNEGLLQARLAKVVIPGTVENELVNQVAHAPTTKMPAIDLVVDDLTVRNRDIGRLEVDAHNLDDNGVPVWQLDKFEVSNPAAKLSATANWRTSRRLGADAPDDSPRRTVIDFKLDIADAGALLERFGLPRTVKKGSGSLSGKIGWRGGPTAIDYPTLTGNVAVDLHHGQILKVDPGVAKLLGVLSLQSLSRVLTLNFKDVIGEGLPFESVTGTGQIKNGIGRTDDFRIVTAPARASMKGTVDLAHETQNLNVDVTPTVNAGSAVIAATIINPLLGLGALAANFALSESLAHAFAIHYAISGSWAHPHIERVHGDRGKMVAPVEAAPATAPAESTGE
ncbi:TIGR02099 family protein [Trinickia violacea]|uniref:TIGR02099 family protein n=1 Tax=Trinickia violacea TaxID=2571746 RepID=A0A4P8IT64_9BURK|nr:YhdP family protein [Trinickia violacea]QCP50955.1 TIGR02099 family protein [Trinickia violacea]